MKFDTKDIEAVAKSRVARAEGNKSTYWFGFAVVLMLIGGLLSRYKTAIGLIIMVLGIILVIYYMQTVSKKQNAYKATLLKAWEAEQQKPPEVAK